MPTSPRVASYVETLEVSREAWEGATAHTQKALRPAVTFKAPRMSAARFALLAAAVFCGVAALALALI